MVACGGDSDREPLSSPLDLVDIGILDTHVSEGV